IKTLNNCLFKILLFCRREGFILLVEHLLYVHPAFDTTCSARRRREEIPKSSSFKMQTVQELKPLKKK
uniref:Uncharacterized protein n=1 Tax=Anas zonorhyncha TaxID=75864 RepID=A0A8B9UFT5_9AVES